MNERITWEDDGTQGNQGGSQRLQSPYALSFDPPLRLSLDLPLSVAPPKPGEEGRLEGLADMLRSRYECWNEEKNRTQDPVEKLRITGILKRIFDKSTAVYNRIANLAGRELYLAGIEATETGEEALKVGNEALEAYRAAGVSVGRDPSLARIEAMEATEATVEPNRAYEAALENFQRITGIKI